MDLRVRVLGEFSVEGLPLSRTGSRKARTLLKILSLARGAPVTVDTLVDALWSGGAPARPADQVSVLVSRLRALIGPDRLPRSDAGYTLLIDWLDLDEADRLLVEARRRLDAGNLTLARAAATAGLALHRGPLLPEEPDAAWAEADRAAALRQAGALAHVAAEAATCAGDPVTAANHARAALERDPYDEVALRLEMRALAASGRPASALHSYAVVRERLAEDLGVSPAPATEELHAALLREEVPTAVAEPPASSPLPGRDAEMAALDHALAEAAVGLRMLVLAGEAGLGKTRLLSEWARRARAAGTIVLWGRCDELGRDLPLQPVADALDAHVRATGLDLGADADALAPLLTATPGVGSALAVPTDHELIRATLFAALLHTLEGLAKTAPVALLIDDLQFAGSSTLQWLRYAARRGGVIPLLVVAACRPEEKPPLPDASVLTLRPLDLEAAEEIVGPERAGALWKRSGGNPLYLTELAAVEGDDLPASIRDAVSARCARAGPGAVTLRTAAVLGPEVDLDLLADVLRQPPVALLADLEDGARRLLLDEEGDGFTFRHQLVREALVAGTTSSRRAFLHREAARALLEREHPDALRVAHHARAGGDHATASDALVTAAGMALDRADPDEAQRLATDALHLIDGPAVRLALGRALLAQARYGEAAEQARAARSLGAGPEALEMEGWCAYYGRDLAGARDRAEKATSVTSTPAVRASGLALTGRIQHAAGDLPGAVAALEEAASLSDEPTVGIWLAQVRLHQGDAPAALSLLDSTTGRRVAQPFAYYHSASARVTALATGGRPAEAMGGLDDLAAEIARRPGADRFAGRVENYRGWILRNLGQWSEADDWNHRAADRPHEIAEEPQRFALADLADGAVRAGHLDQAARLMDQAGEPWEGEPVFRWRQLLKLRLLRARLFLASGQDDEAAAWAGALRTEAAALGIPRYEAQAALVEAEATGRADAVPGLLDVLDRQAGLESWWLAAEVAAHFGVDEWWRRAEDRAAALAARAGPYRERFEKVAGAIVTLR